MFSSVIKEGFFLVLVCSLVPLVFCAISGLIISLIQALTQIQEQSIGYVVKFFTLCAVLWCFSDLIQTRLITFIQECINGLSYLGQMP